MAIQGPNQMKRRPQASDLPFVIVHQQENGLHRCTYGDEDIAGWYWCICGNLLSWREALPELYEQHPGLSPA